MKADAAAPSLWARRLGFGGLIPFVGLAATLWLAPPSSWPLAGLALVGYGATICSFLGAIHWGLVMRDAQPAPMAPLIWGVLPSLVSWVALLLAPALGLVLIAALLWACYAVDRVQYARHQLQAWLPLRLQLTLVASVSCLAGAAALA